MKTKILLLGALAAVVLSSCKTSTSYSYSEFKTSDPTVNVFAVPQIAELAVSATKITYSERLNKDIREMSSSAAESFAMTEKETVLNNAIKANNADVLIAPNITVTTDNQGRLVITVTGYPANYTGFRNATSGDEWIIKNSESVNDPMPKTKAKKSLFNLF
ncbi:MAG: hypothetical protein MJ010_02655 [Paludibacteraceae bacterium]|nr:hypothetical protein [Paludibacteraceae bacterium]